MLSEGEPGASPTDGLRDGHHCERFYGEKTFRAQVAAKRLLVIPSRPFPCGLGGETLLIFGGRLTLRGQMTLVTRRQALFIFR